MNFMPTSRLLPLLLFVAFVALGVRVGDFWSLAQGGGGFRIMQTSVAEEPKKAEAEVAAEPPHASPPAATPEAGEKSPEKPLESLEKPAENPPATASAEANESASPVELTPAEMDVLQNLSARRKEIEQRARDLDARDALIAAAEQRVDQKVKELQGLREELKGLLRQIDEQQQARVASMVKLYETMKPREAAAVLETLDMDVAIDVFSGMKETKMAPILAAMNPQKASEITVHMMQRQKLPELPTN